MASPVSSISITEAVANGHFDATKLLISHFTCAQARLPGLDLPRVAATNNHLEILQWLHKSLHLGCSTVVLTRAARNGHMEIVQWLLERQLTGDPSPFSSITDAASQGHLAIVKLLHPDPDSACTHREMNGTAAHGHLDVVQ